MPQFQIPDEMTAVVLDSYSGVEALRIEKRPVPRPEKNQVLVKIAASPINPSDLMFLEGLYGLKKPTPTIPGFEGSGTVVQTGGGVMGSYLLGKQVACLSGERGDGVWAGYLLTRADYALPLGKAVDLEQGAMSVVNPLTAIALLSIARKGGHSYIISTAAASALGQMINRLSRAEGIQVINIVRREEQVELLRQQGAAIILNSSDADFDRQLRDICHQNKVRLAVDAIAGTMPVRLLAAMPHSSKVTVYGGLSLQAAQVDSRQLIFENKSVDGFWLAAWLTQKNLLQKLADWQRAQKLMGTDLKSEVRARYPLHEAKQAILDYQSQMTGGKVLLIPEG